jgi:hypothetical protein
MGALVQCLGQPDGCKVVPGLPPEQYYFTLWSSIAGGIVAGFVAKIEPQGEQQVARFALATAAAGKAPCMHHYAFVPCAAAAAAAATMKLGCWVCSSKPLNDDGFSNSFGLCTCSCCQSGAGVAVLVN